MQKWLASHGLSPDLEAFKSMLPAADVSAPPTYSQGFKCAWGSMFSIEEDAGEPREFTKRAATITDMVVTQAW